MEGAMRISVLGTGTVGTALAIGLAEAGHDVAVGTRDGSRPQAAEVAASLPGSARLTGYRDAVEDGDLVFMAVPGRLVVEVAEQIGTDAFAGKVVVDLTNPAVVDESGVRSAFGEEDSAAEALQRALPGAHVVKAFNQIEAGVMTSPAPDEKRPLRIAGDDVASKSVVAGLGESLGWKIRDLGPLSRSRALERGFIDWLASQQR
jgi:8-hydroxy-5-deazaflavin:NADPH oxidoreductase